MKMSTALLHFFVVCLMSVLHWDADSTYVQAVLLKPRRVGPSFQHGAPDAAQASPAGASVGASTSVEPVEVHAYPVGASTSREPVAVEGAPVGTGNEVTAAASDIQFEATLLTSASGAPPLVVQPDNALFVVAPDNQQGPLYIKNPDQAKFRVGQMYKNVRSWSFFTDMDSLWKVYVDGNGRYFLSECNPRTRKCDEYYTTGEEDLKKRSLLGRILRLRKVRTVETLENHIGGSNNDNMGGELWRGLNEADFFIVDFLLYFKTSKVNTFEPGKYYVHKDKQCRSSFADRNSLWKVVQAEDSGKEEWVLRECNPENRECDIKEVKGKNVRELPLTLVGVHKIKTPKNEDEKQFWEECKEKAYEEEA